MLPLPVLLVALLATHVTGQACSTYKDCATCTAVSGCGYCGMSSTCVEGTKAGAAAGQCASGGEAWSFGASTCLPTGVDLCQEGPHCGQCKSYCGAVGQKCSDSVWYKVTACYYYADNHCDCRREALTTTGTVLIVLFVTLGMTLIITAACAIARRIRSRTPTSYRRMTGVMPMDKPRGSVDTPESSSQPFEWASPQQYEPRPLNPMNPFPSTTYGAVALPPESPSTATSGGYQPPPLQLGTNQEQPLLRN